MIDIPVTISIDRDKIANLQEIREYLYCNSVNVREWLNRQSNYRLPDEDTLWAIILEQYYTIQYIVDEKIKNYPTPTLIIKAPQKP